MATWRRGAIHIERSAIRLWRLGTRLLSLVARSHIAAERYETLEASELASAAMVSGARLQSLVARSNVTARYETLEASELASLRW